MEIAIALQFHTVTARESKIASAALAESMHQSSNRLSIKNPLAILKGKVENSIIEFLTSEPPRRFVHASQNPMRLEFESGRSSR